MKTLSVFNFLSLNGFYKGAGNDISWHSHGGSEEREYSISSSSSGNTLLFGRVTFEMMAGFWQSPLAAEQYPEVAKNINEAEKFVISNTLEHANWQNSTIMSGDIIEGVTHLKETGQNDLTILGSGSIVSQLAEAGLIDSFQFMIDPVVLPAGTTLFSGISRKISLKLIDSKTFNSGTILLSYKPEYHEQP